MSIFDVRCNGKRRYEDPDDIIYGEFAGDSEAVERAELQLIHGLKINKLRLYEFTVNVVG